MPTLAELIGANPEKVQNFLDLARASEEEKAKPEFASKKAKALSKAAKAAEGSVGKEVISDLPRVSGKMASAMEKAASAAKGALGEDVISDLPLPSKDSRMPLGSEKDILKKAAEVTEQRIKDASELAKQATKAEVPMASSVTKTPFLQKIAGLASTSAGKKLLAGVGGIGFLSGLYGDEGVGPEPNDPYLNPPKKLDYTPPSTEKSDLNPPMASSMYDSLGSIIADTSRPPVLEERALAAKEEPAEKILTPKPRTVSAGEPTAAAVAKQAEDAQLAQILGQKSEYEDLLARYKDAEERQRLAQLGVSLGQAGERIGSAIAMVKPGDQSFYEEQMKIAGGITDRFKEEETVRREAKRNDANSEESKSARALLKEQGIAVPETVTAAFIEKQYPQFANIISQRRAAEERAEGRRERAEERALTKQERKEEKLGDFIKDARRFATTGDIGKVRGRLIKAENSIELFDKYSKGSPTGAKDLAGFFGFMKGVQQDDSVIREAEARLGLSLGSLSSRVKGQLARFFRGEMFSPEQRRQMLEVLEIQASQLKKEYTSELKPLYDDLKTQPGMSNKDAKTEFKRITSLDLDFDGESEDKKETIKLPQKQTGKAGKTIVSKDGKRYVVNADEITATEL